MISEFVFKLFKGISPLDRFSSLIVIGDVVVECGVQGRRTDKVRGLQTCALQHTEPDFKLIEKGGHWSVTRAPESAVARHKHLPARGASLRVAWGRASFHYRE